MKNILGTTAATHESAVVALAMLAIVSIYEGAMYLVIADFALNWYEFLGTWFVMVAVWLVRTQNIQNWLWGILGVVLLGIFFGQIGLPGQQWLQWAFFVPVQFWSWYHWASGGRDDESLPVTLLSPGERLVWVLMLVLGTLGLAQFIELVAPGSQYPHLDALVVVASMIAQFLMGRKKVESWLLWLGPVNIISIILFSLSGAFVLTALYVAFFIHACFGVRSWYNARAI